MKWTSAGQTLHKYMPGKSAGRCKEGLDPMSATDTKEMNMVVRSPRDSDSNCLDTWKEIAVYLNREVRTVQRWEKREGLPVHRHIHLKGSTVYALKEEINVWLTGRGQTPSNSRRMQRRSRPPANELNPAPHVIRQMLTAFGLWLAVVAKDSYQDSDDLAVPDARKAPGDSHLLTQRPQSKRKVRARQLVTRRESRPLSLAYLREGVKIQNDHEFHQSGEGNTEPDIYWSGLEGLV